MISIWDKMHFLLVIFTARQYIYNMTITQTVDIPASRRLTIDVPREDVENDGGAGNGTYQPLCRQAKPGSP